MPRIRLLTLAALCAFLARTALVAQPLAPSAAPTPLSTDAKTLAKYDKNKNGRLDPDELAAKASDDAKSAQSSVQTKPADAADVITLSPFEVNSADDQGYSASSSLSGTRLNSRLEDIAGSVSVVTKQQLTDTAALDLNDIFLYEVGTEGTGQFTDPTNDGRGDYDNVAGNPTGANRMRGLSQANILVDGFTASTSIPVDIYNVDAVEIARGPNSTLAGLSDAGGSVNLIAGRANVTRETTNFQTRWDSYDGRRATLDINRPIIRNKFSLRFSAVYNEVGYVRKPSVDRTNRQQLSFTARPFKGTTLSGSYEWFHEWASRANSITPQDTVSVWRSRGSPTYDLSTRTFTLNGVRSAQITNPNTELPSGLALLGSANVRILEYIDDGEIKYLMRGANPGNTPSAPQQFTQSSNDSLAGPLYKLSGTTDKSLYDWTRINLAAPNYETNQADIATLRLEQKLLGTTRHRLDLNLGWRREEQSNYRRMFIAQQDGVGSRILVDTNEKLQDGRPNPFFLHPFIGGVNPQTNRRPSFAENYRAQLAYQLDLTHEKGWLKWLGQHRANTFAELRRTITSPNSLRGHDSVVDNPDFLGPGVTAPTPTTNLTSSSGALLYPLYYYGKTPGGGVEYANTGPRKPNGKYTASFLNTATNTWNYDDPVTLREVYFSSGKQKKILRTEGFNVQSFFLNSRVVTTLGIRKDRNYSIDNLPLQLAGGYFDETNLDNFGRNKKWKHGTTTNKGIVVKPFRDLAFLDHTATHSSGLPRYFAELVRGFNFHLNRADTFQPADTAYNLYLQELPNPTSHTEEFGFSLNLFRKFSLRLTHHETVQVHTRAGTGAIATRALSLDFDVPGQTRTFDLYTAATGWQQIQHPEYTLTQAQDAAAKQIGYTTEFVATATGKTISDASDARSRGWDLELQFNPNRYWTLKATGTQQEAIDTNISLFIQQFIQERLPIWTTITAPDGTLWWKTRLGSDGIPENYFINLIQNPLNLATTTQGKRKPQTREYTFNAITSYQLAGLGGLTDSSAFRWMRNTTVGGSYRWASKAAIGYLGGAPDSDGVLRKLDRTKPVFDRATANLSLLLTYRTRLFHDRIGARFQLNVNNVNESGHLQRIAVNPDGRAWNYRIVDPRQFVFTSSFDL